MNRFIPLAFVLLCMVVVFAYFIGRFNGYNNGWDIGWRYGVTNEHIYNVGYHDGAEWARKTNPDYIKWLSDINSR